MFRRDCNSFGGEQHSLGVKVAPKRDELHYSDLQYIYICIYVSHIYAIVNWDITISC